MSVQPLLNTFGTIMLYFLATFSINLVAQLFMKDLEGSRNVLEANSLIYVVIVGIFIMRDDFKMLIQNGFTRWYIFLGNISFFTFICAILSFISTTVTMLPLPRLLGEYTSLTKVIYNNDNSFINFVLVFLLHLVVVLFGYLITLIFNRVGKNRAIILGITMGLLVMMAPGIVLYSMTPEWRQALLNGVICLIGISSSGEVNYLVPISVLLCMALIFGCLAYRVLRRLNVK